VIARRSRIITAAMLIGSASLAAAQTPTPGPAARAGNAIDRAWSAVSDELADAILKTKIRVAMLEHLKSDGLRVQIDVKAGVVDLSGQVGKRANRMLARDVAASVEGVKEVRSRVEVAPAEATPPPVTKFVGKVEHGFGDALLEAKVKGRLLEELGKTAFKIDVDAADGVVSLTGTVPDGARRDLAVRTARATDGVKELHDLLKIAP